ncbi:unnamed protein product [Oncorhynchus mykiss]|uniref:Uncharacterized protein n=1 Tax=Oncorhynchus mykiss TaxID=8022 RepID=A0A060YLY8_ONCMY|nr:unnamed protein product [Oncorhynchus mykiss]
MAFLEKQSPGRVLLDDTVALTALIEASQNLQSHTVSLLRPGKWTQTVGSSYLTQCITVKINKQTVYLWTSDHLL